MLRIDDTHSGSLIFCHDSIFAVIDKFSECAADAGGCYGSGMASSIQTTCINKSGSYSCY